MKKFEEFLEEYGLKLCLPENENTKQALLIREKQLGKYDLEGGMLWLLSFGFKVKVNDVEKLFKQFSIPEKYDMVKPIIQDSIKLKVYTVLSVLTKGERKIVSDWLEDFEYNSFLDDLRKDISENPKKYGISENQLKLIKTFGSESAMINEEMDKRYDCFMNFVSEINDEIKRETEIFLNKMAELMNEKKMDKKWLREKMAAM